MNSQIILFSLSLMELPKLKFVNTIIKKGITLANGNAPIFNQLLISDIPIAYYRL